MLPFLSCLVPWGPVSTVVVTCVCLCESLFVGLRIRSKHSEAGKQRGVKFIPKKGKQKKPKNLETRRTEATNILF